MGIKPTKLIQVTPDIRVESGPARKRALATQELLDNSRTAPHYYEGVRKVGKELKRGVDALGKPIQIGQHMDYLDWHNEYVWYIYQKNDQGRYIRITNYPTEAAAVLAASKLAPDTWKQEGKS